MKIVFFGTSDYCLPVLETLHKNFDLTLVVTRPDKPIGRKKIFTPSATKLWAKKNNVPVTTPTTLKKDTLDRLSFLSILNDLNPDLAVVSDFGLIIPEGIFSLPHLGTINIHFSKLPDLRGPSPVQSTLLRGDTSAWITIFKLENPPELEIKMDSGPILWQKSYPILPDDTTSILYTRLFQEAAKELPKVIKSFVNGHLSLVSQDHAKATFCQFLTRADGFIDWKVLQPSLQGRTLLPLSPLSLKSTSLQEPVSSIQIYNRFRALSPWPGLWTINPKGKRMKILKCHLKNDRLVLDQIQFEGEKPHPPSQGLPL